MQALGLTDIKEAFDIALPPVSSIVYSSLEQRPRRDFDNHNTYFEILEVI